MARTTRETETRPAPARRRAAPAAPTTRAAAPLPTRGRGTRKASSAPTSATDSADAGPTRTAHARAVGEDDVRLLAYLLWLERQETSSDPKADWFEAERRLRG